MAGKENPGSISSSMAGVATPVRHQGWSQHPNLTPNQELAHARQPIQPAQRIRWARSRAPIRLHFFIWNAMNNEHGAILAPNYEAMLAHLDRFFGWPQTSYRDPRFEMRFISESGFENRQFDVTDDGIIQAVAAAV